MDLRHEKELLLSSLIREGYLRTPAVISAFRSIQRELFVPREFARYAYVDEPLPIGAGQTISAPHMVALITELSQPNKSDKVLEIGGGSGYQAAILSKLVKNVIAIELEEQLAAFAQNNLKRAHITNVSILCTDGSRGHAKESPYDKIVFSCSVSGIPKIILSQLKLGGLLIAPVGPEGHQDLLVYRKKRKTLEISSHGSCVFVPLRH